MKRKYRGYTILLLLASISLASCFHDDDGNGGSVPIFQAKESFSFEVAAGNHTQLNMQGVNGEITITGESAVDSVMISGIKLVQSTISTEDAQLHLQELEVEVDWKSLANVVSVETIQPKDTVDRNYIIDYTITLPTYFQIQVESVNGIVTLDSIENDVTVRMANANVTLMNIQGSAMVTLANGTIESEVVLPLNGTIDLGVAIGDIHLTIPVNTSAEFFASVLNGSINVSTNLVFQNEVKTSTSLSGTLGSGQGMISLMTIGDIRVTGIN